MKTLSARLAEYEFERHGDGAWRVVKAVFEEYGWPFEVEGYDADVARPDLWYPQRGGGFVVAEAEGSAGAPEVVGCVGYTDEGGGLFELHRLYVLPTARKGGLGVRLVSWVIDEVRARGGTRLELFSDIALRDAHRLYGRMGFRRTRFRYAPDPFQSREWGFEMDLTKETT